MIIIYKFLNEYSPFNFKKNLFIKKEFIFIINFLYMKNQDKYIIFI